MTFDATITLSLPTPLAQTSSAPRREIVFIESGTRAMVAQAQRFALRGDTRFVVIGARDAVRGIIEALRAQHPAAVESSEVPPPADAPGTVHVYAGIDDDALGDALLRHVDARNAVVIAPIGVRHSSRLPLFLISIPKAGTHLLYELARALGYDDGVVCPEAPRGGTWYCIEFSNSHTTARDFLVDTTRRSPFGNKHHSFFRSPALFIYRNPLDVLVSEANWFHDPRHSPLAGYLSGLDLSARLMRLADDPWLLGSIRDRVGAFIPWLDFPNVIPLSFEELVGAKGGGSDEAQRDIIWSIQLKLQVGGAPSDIAHRVFNFDSPTFTEGRVGSWSRHRTKALEERVNNLPSDYLQAYGFGPDGKGMSPVLPRNADVYRRRRLRLAETDFGETPIALEMNFCDHNLVAHRGTIFAIPLALGPLDPASLSTRPPAGVISAPTLEEAKLRVWRRRIRYGVLWRFWVGLLARAFKVVRR